jgi:hypothetical protein
MTMSLFGSILSKLGITPGAAPVPPAPAPAGTRTPAATVSPAQATPVPAAEAPKYVVDVPAKLDLLVTMSKQKLDWRHSIVDLLKALGLDSSFAARKALAIELDCPADKMADSAQMNMWLHKAVMRKLADNQGNIPPELLD